MTTEKTTNGVPKELTPQQAINILVQAVHMGQKAGVYSLDDAALIKSAVDVFVKPTEKEVAPQDEKAPEPQKESA